MKEVKIFQLHNFVDSDEVYLETPTSQREEAERNLASWLNAGWEIAGTGGEYVNYGFVILVRER